MKHQRTLHLGPRARRAVRFVARFVNPVVLLVAGRRWMPVVGVLRHRGRRSGRVYASPLGMRPSADGFVIPLTFRESAAWYRNLLAAGSAEVTYAGRRHDVQGPEVIDYGLAAPFFPRYERLQFRALGITQFLRLTSVDSREVPMSNRRRSTTLALGVITTAQLMVVLDVAIVNVALPSIQRALGFDATGLEWVVNAYAIAFGGLLLLGGRAGDMFGRLRVFVLGTVLFTAGSLAGGLAGSSTALILARALQGVGAAIVAPTALSLVADTFAEGASRNRALGVYSAASASGGALGLLLGGVITNYFSWRWILFVNVPVGVALALIAPRVLAASPARRGRLDLPGAAAVTAGATLLVYGLSRAAIHGWTDQVTVVTLGGGFALLAVFVALEAVSRSPLMPLGIFANRIRSGAYALSLTTGAALSGTLFTLTLFLQNVLGLTPLQAGFAFLPTAAGVVVGAGVTSRLIARTGPRLPMAAGALMAATGLFWLSAITDHAAYPAAVLGPLAVLAVGLGQVFVSTSTTAIAGARRDESGIVSAVLNVGRQLGGSIGIALMGTLATTVAENADAAPPVALTHGFSASFQLAGFIALLGFAATIAAVRRPRRALGVEAVEAQAA
ncbi:MAG TPA: MFS transporter [Candidatus Dormibacteraeota bacterium]|nr:MFS transporter [Candidatus Dormibacteraeota bacterium]